MSRRDVAERMGEAAAALLASLDGGQRELAAWPFPADDERRRWFYTPTDHGGLTLHAMAPAQQRATMRLLRTGLSRPAYVTATTIIGLENVLDEAEGWTVSFGRERGRDPGMYYVRIFGEPASRGRGAGASGATTCRSTTPSSTASSSPRRRASWAPTRPRRRCSVRTSCGHWPAPRTSGGSSSGRSMPTSSPPR